MDLPRRQVPAGEVAEQRRRSRRSLAAMLVSEHQPSPLREPSCGRQRCADGHGWPRCAGGASSRLLLPSVDWGALALRFLCILGHQRFPSCTLASSPPVCCIPGALIMLCEEQRDVLVPAVVMNPASPVLETRGGTAGAPAKPSPVALG